MRTITRLATVAALSAGVAFAAAPAQAAFGCDQRDVPNGWYNRCWGVPDPHQYQSQVTCGLASSPQRTYIAKGPWRSYGTGNPSVATCNSGDYYRGEHQLNFR